MHFDGVLGFAEATHEAQLYLLTRYGAGLVSGFGGVLGVAVDTHEAPVHRFVQAL